jgi:hypothetical protein
MKNVIRTHEEAKGYTSLDPALVEVPGDLVRVIYRVVHRLGFQSSSRQKKAVKALLRSVAKIEKKE